MKNFIFLLIALGGLPRLSLQCMAQYKKELRYLDFYLGIVPANEDGAIDSDGLFCVLG
jgi:hypothetical protein